MIVLLFLISSCFCTLAEEVNEIAMGVLPSDLDRLNLLRSGENEKFGKVQYGNVMKIKAYFAGTEPTARVLTPKTWGEEFVYVRGPLWLRDDNGEVKKQSGLFMFEDNIYVPTKSLKLVEKLAPNTTLISIPEDTYNGDEIESDEADVAQDIYMDKGGEQFLPVQDEVLIPGDPFPSNDGTVKDTGGNSASDDASLEAKTPGGQENSNANPQDSTPHKTNTVDVPANKQNLQESGVSEQKEGGVQVPGARLGEVIPEDPVPGPGDGQREDSPADQTVADDTQVKIGVAGDTREEGDVAKDPQNQQVAGEPQDEGTAATSKLDESIGGQDLQDNGSIARSTPDRSPVVEPVNTHTELEQSEEDKTASLDGDQQTSNAEVQRRDTDTDNEENLGESIFSHQRDKSTHTVDTEADDNAVGHIVEQTDPQTATPKNQEGLDADSDDSRSSASNDAENARAGGDADQDRTAAEHTSDVTKVTDGAVIIRYIERSEFEDKLQNLSPSQNYLDGFGSIQIRPSANRKTNVVQFEEKLKILKVKHGRIFKELILSDVFYKISTKELFSEGVLIDDVYFIRKAGKSEKLIEDVYGPQKPKKQTYGLNIPYDIFDEDMRDSINFDGECVDASAMNLIEYRNDVVFKTHCREGTNKIIATGLFIINGDAGDRVNVIEFDGGGMKLYYYIKDQMYELFRKDTITIQRGNTFSYYRSLIQSPIIIRTRVRYIDVEGLHQDLATIEDALENACKSVTNRRHEIKMFEYYGTRIDAEYICDYQMIYINQQLTVLDRNKDGEISDIRKCDGMWYYQRSRPTWRCDKQPTNPFAIRLVTYNYKGLDIKQTLDSDHFTKQNITVEALHRTLRSMRTAFVKSGYDSRKFFRIHLKPDELGLVSIEDRPIVTLNSRMLVRDKKTNDLQGIYAEGNYRWTAGAWPPTTSLYFDGWHLYQSGGIKWKHHIPIPYNNIVIETEDDPKDVVETCPLDKCIMKTRRNFMYFRNLWNILKRQKDVCSGYSKRRLMVQFKSTFYIEGVIECDTNNIYFPAGHTILSFSGDPDQLGSRQIIRDDVVFGLTYSMRVDTFHSKIGGMDTAYAIEMFPKGATDKPGQADPEVPNFSVSVHHF